jgi:biopolymer transport protein ExbB
MSYTLLQVTMPVTTEPQEAHLSLFDLLIKGGWVMIPILLLLVVAIWVFFERLIAISRANKGDKNFMDNIRDLMLTGNMDGAKAFCKNSNTPQARVVEKGIQRLGKPVNEIEAAMQDAGKLELYKVEKGLSILSIVGRIAPMLGFIGTIIGVINIFYKISLSKTVEIDVISEGLYQKMITSAAGLTIGVFAFVCYNILNMMVDKIVNRMETSSAQFMDVINEPSKQ